MGKYVIHISCFFLFRACKTNKKVNGEGKLSKIASDFQSDFTLAFGSCNKPEEPNLSWDDIRATQPDLWNWGGDNIYADTDNMKRLRTMYGAQNEVTGYEELKKQVSVIGTWDDHDYGLNDGVEFTAKEESQ